LCGNAAKFTSDGVIRIIVAPIVADRVVELTVADTGIGIPQNKVEQIFDPFTQADSSTAREYGGTGLGLAISRKLAELLGGSLRATSQLGIGSQFTLRLPHTGILLDGKRAPR
ncbi:MAG TPA: ATP-binding protein, partial [Nannocystis exedens]|nr:ATP-binding protein [Nannocystis exedens]